MGLSALSKAYIIAGSRKCVTFVTPRFGGQPSDRSVDSIARPASGQLIVRRVRSQENVLGSFIFPLLSRLVPRVNGRLFQPVMPSIASVRKFHQITFQSELRLDDERVKIMEPKLEHCRYCIK